VAYFRVFGCRAWVHNNKGKKLDAKGLPMVFVGYEPSSKAYRLWNPANHKVVISSDVIFDETLLPNKPATPLVIPPVVAKRLDTPYKASEGKRVAFTTLPLLLFDENDNDTPVVPRYVPPHLRRAPSAASSSPGTPGRVPPLASREPSNSPPHSPTSRPRVWKKVFTDSDDETNEVEQLVGDEDEPLPEAPFPPGDNLTMQAGSPHSSVLTPPPSTPAPSSVAFSMPSTLNSPNPDSVYSDSEFIEEDPRSRRSQRKKKQTERYAGEDVNLIASEESIRELKKLDNAYFDRVKLFISAATSHGEPRTYAEAVHHENPDSPHWIEAVEAELKSLQDHGVWEYVP